MSLLAFRDLSRARFLCRGQSRTGRLAPSVLLLLLSAAAAASANDQFRTAPALGQPDALGGYATTHILVRLAPDVPITRSASGLLESIDAGPIDALAAAWGVTSYEPLLAGPAGRPELAAQLGLDRTIRFDVPRGTSTPEMVAEFSALPGVELAELDGVGGIAEVVPNDLFFVNQWALKNTGQSGGTVDADVDATDAWDIHTGTSSVLIAILDTGVQANHPDLNGKVTPGWNTWDENADTSDPHGHGTHVAGIAGAFGNNSIGVAGMNWGVSLLAVRCTNEFGGSTESEAAQALIWATDYGTNIANMSLQFYSGTTTLHDAVLYADAADVLMIAATGNGAGNVVAFPARWDECIAVGATDRFDAWASFSNYGPEIDVSAPGKEVYSTWRASTYRYNDGTSMATPCVSGLASLLMSYNFALSNAQIRQIIINTAEDRGDPGFDEKFGNGRVNAYAALLAADPQGDLNCDGEVNNADIAAFVVALIDPDSYPIAYPGCDLQRADVDGDGTINNADIPRFVTMLTGE